MASFAFATVALLFRRAAENWPSSSGNANNANGQTDRIIVPYSITAAIHYSALKATLFKIAAQH
jgi:hypothetical protein